MRADEGSNPAGRDAGLIALATGAVAVACAQFDFSEQILHWTAPLEHYQIDELPIVLLFLACALAWFAWRRTREMRRELALRLLTESSLMQALAANRTLVVAGAQAQEEERRRVARELHDELGQCINAIKLDAVGIRQRAADVELRRDAAAIVELADRAQRATRDIVRELRPPGLDELGLVAALESCVDGWRRRMPSVRFVLATPQAELPPLGEATSIALFRLVQEGLTNVVRHARPARVEVALSYAPPGAALAGEIVVSIVNDGVGDAMPSRGRGLGIPGMRERIEALGGRVVATAAARAFALEARVPVPAGSST